jgi:hypothetical protein
MDRAFLPEIQEDLEQLVRLHFFKKEDIGMTKRKKE